MIRRTSLGRKLSAALLLMAAVAPVARAHFPFIVANDGGATARFFLSEDLKPDPQVKARHVDQTKLTLRTADGKDTPLALTAGEKFVSVALPAADGVRVVYGSMDLGVMKHGERPGYYLNYHPKAIIGDAFDKKAVLGQSVTPIEITPAGDSKSLWFVVTIDGKPAPAGTEVHVIKPDASQEKFETDDKGRTEPFTATGRYGAWAKTVVAKGGKVGDKEFAETRHYATLVFDNGQASAADLAKAAASEAPATQPTAAVRTFTPLPEAVSSFGAVVAGDSLYVYGGHTAKTHSYDTTAVSKRFHRLNLAKPGATWEELPGGPGIQGMNLASYNGKVYRVGGMEPRNAPGTEADNYSLTQAVVFDPAVGKWADLPALPHGRSSHDLAVVDGRLFVIGGWTMAGDKGGNEWPESMLALDLKADKPEWKEIAQPFKRRALIVSVVGEKIYIFGGFTEDSDPSRDVDIYDAKAGTWTKGPQLPGNAMNGFAPAAIARGQDLFVSVGDGGLYRLHDDHWELVAKTTPRIVHRLATFGPEVLVIGGAAKGNNFDLIEAVNVAPATKVTSAR